MKKFIIIILSVAIFLTIGIVGLKNGKTENQEYLRIHIRANSNLEQDQSVKYEIKEKVVEFLTPIIARVNSKKQAEKVITENLKKIEKIADGVLKEEGYGYTSNAKILNEKFPTRKYNDLVLENGYYDALILNLGSGQGDNWWCVVYPPLCFLESNSDYIIKSKIYEIIENFNKRREG